MNSSKMEWTSVPFVLGSMVKMACGRSRTSMRRTRSMRYRLGHSAVGLEAGGREGRCVDRRGDAAADPAVEAGEPVELAGPPDLETGPEHRLELGQVVTSDPISGVAPGQELTKVSVGYGHRLAVGPDRRGERRDDLVALEGCQLIHITAEQATMAALQDSQRIEQPACRTLLSAPALVASGIGQDLDGSGGERGQVVASIVVGTAPSQRDIRSRRAPLGIGEQGVVVDPGGERTIDHAQNEDGVEVESGEQPDGPDEDPVPTRGLGRQRLELHLDGLAEGGAVGLRAQAVQHGQTIRGGANSGECFLFFRGPRIAVPRVGRDTRRRTWSASSTTRPTSRR